MEISRIRVVWYEAPNPAGTAKAGVTQVLFCGPSLGMIGSAGREESISVL
jgi:hypothetical protein